MSQLTTPTEADPYAYVAALSDERQRADSLELLALMGEVTGVEPIMWGPSMIGFGSYRYRYASGHEGDYFVVGFAPRRGKLAVYNLTAMPVAASLLDTLGAHTRGASCLYIKRLSDIDRVVLRQLIAAAWADGGNILGLRS